MNLQEMLYITRSQLNDLAVKKWSEPELVAYANEGKNALVNIIRQAREDYFLSNTSSNVAIASAPNPSTMTLPTDFLELKNISCTSTGYTDIEFIHCDQVKPRFRHALADGAAIGNGTGIILYDIYGNSSIKFAPGFDVQLTISVDYIQTVADMVLPEETIASVPTYLHDYVPNYATCKALASKADPRYTIYKAALNSQEDRIRTEIQPRQIREAKFAKGFMEDEEF